MTNKQNRDNILYPTWDKKTVDVGKIRSQVLNLIKDNMDRAMREYERKLAEESLRETIERNENK